MKPQPPVTRIRTATASSRAAEVKHHTKVTKDTTVANLNENRIAKQVLDTAFVVHTKLGPGVFESVDEVVLAHELRKAGLLVERQRPMSIVYDNTHFEEAFRSDLAVNGKVIVELKSVAALSDVHAKQLLTQLRLSGLKLGLLINFGEAHLKNGIRRIIDGQIEPPEIENVAL